jgi:two-component system chemotaxis sensor kinase CheA
LRDEYVPVIRLFEVFNIEPKSRSIFEGLIVVVESGNHKIGLHVDDLLAQQQVVIKSLDTNYKRVEGLSGATILGDGTVALILDIAGLLNIVGSDIFQSPAVMKTAI